MTEEEEESQFVVYKIEELNETLIKKNINLNNPVKKNTFYFCKNKTNFYVQIKNIQSIKAFYKFNEKIFINFDLEEYNETNKHIYDMFENTDNILISTISSLFEKWFQKKNNRYRFNGILCSNCFIKRFITK